MDATCNACGFANLAGARFCGRCGTALRLVCDVCGAAVAAGLAFCTACGAELARPAGLERKVVSVLFADAVEFTRRAERLDPEEVRALLDPFYARVRAELERYGGTVEKFIGDAVMALFGAPVAHEDDPERAVRAACAVRDAVRALDDEDPALDLHVRIGVTTGEVVVSLGARPQLGEAMAHGDVVNTAARLQAGAPVDGILADEATYRATLSRIEYRVAEPVRAKGKSEPVQVWEVVGARSRPGFDPEPGRTRLVNRERELGGLVESLARARAEGVPQLVTLVGEPGIGKSRLVSELALRVGEEPELVWWRRGRCLPYGEGVTFWALGEMVKAQAGILETDSGDEAVEKLRLAVDDAVGDPGEARWVEAHLRPLVGLAIEEALRGDRRVEAFAAWRRFLAGLAADSPLVLVFEDLHWADDDLLDFVGDELPRITGPVLAVATCRPELLERRPGWGSDGTIVTVSPLTDDETARLVAAILDQPVLPAELQAALLARAGGNPLYAEEYLRMLQERGTLRRGGRGWALDPGSEVPPPESVQGLIAARLDSLPADEKVLLQDAAVVGRVFWLGALTAVADAPRRALEQRLGQLERRQLVRRDPVSEVASEPQYAFLHGLVRDVAYAQMPRSLRSEKHQLAARWIESLSPDRSADRAEMLAFHYSSALEYASGGGVETERLAEAAVVALRDAGERALALNAFSAATRFFASALELAAEDPVARAELLAGLGKARFHAEGTGGEALAEARRLLLEQRRVGPAAEAAVTLAELRWSRGEGDESFQLLEEALATLEDEPPSRAKTAVLSSLARFLMVADRNREAIEMARRALAMAGGLGLRELKAHALDNLGVARVTSGDQDGIRDLEESIAIASELNSLESLRGLSNLGTMLVSLGDLHGAFDAYDRGRRAAERFGDRNSVRWFESERVYEDYWRGRWDDAERLATESLEELEAGEPNAMELDCRLVRGRIRLGRGDAEGALDDAARAVAFARRANYPEVLVQALAFDVRSLAESGLPGPAADRAAELSRVIAGDDLVGSFWVGDLALGLALLGGSGASLGEDLAPTSWLEAARLLVAGEHEAAANRYRLIGSLPDEALARLLGAEAAPPAGSRGRPDAGLESAFRFFRLAGATEYAERAGALLERPSSSSGPALGGTA